MQVSKYSILGGTEAGAVSWPGSLATRAGQRTAPAQITVLLKVLPKGQRAEVGTPFLPPSRTRGSPGPLTCGHIHGTAQPGMSWADHHGAKKELLGASLCFVPTKRHIPLLNNIPKFRKGRGGHTSASGHLGGQGWNATLPSPNIYRESTAKTTRFCC